MTEGVLQNFLKELHNSELTAYSFLIKQVKHR